MSLPTASCVDTFFAWQVSCSQQQLRCSGCLDSTSTMFVTSMIACLSMRKRKGVGERKRAYADENATKSTLINFENRQVLVGDLQQKTCWMACASACKGNKKYSGHPLRLFPSYMSQWTRHLLLIKCIAWPMFATPKIHLLFLWVAFCTYGLKNEQLNIQQPDNNWSGGKSWSRGDICCSHQPPRADQLYTPPETMEGRSTDETWRSVKER